VGVVEAAETTVVVEGSRRGILCAIGVVRLGTCLEHALLPAVRGATTPLAARVAARVAARGAARGATTLLTAKVTTTLLTAKVAALSAATVEAAATRAGTSVAATSWIASVEL
jgi:hypothetical protein